MCIRPARRNFREGEPAMGFNASDANLYRYGGNDPSNVVDPSGQATKLDPVDVMTPGKKKVGTLQVEYGSFPKEDLPGIKAVFTSQEGKPATLKAAAQAYDAKKGDHFNWYQVVIEDNNPLYFYDFGKKKVFKCKPPYVDPPPDGYRKANGDYYGEAHDGLPWFFNEGKWYARSKSGISYFTEDPKLKYQDFPKDPGKEGKETTIKFKTWLVVLDTASKFVAWAGVGFEWEWSNPKGKPVVKKPKMISGAPDATLLPEKLFPPKGS
jgi:hypothetical protein